MNSFLNWLLKSTYRVVRNKSGKFIVEVRSWETLWIYVVYVRNDSDRHVHADVPPFEFDNIHAAEYVSNRLNSKYAD